MWDNLADILQKVAAKKPVKNWLLCVGRETLRNAWSVTGWTTRKIQLKIQLKQITSSTVKLLALDLYEVIVDEGEALINCYLLV